MYLEGPSNHNSDLRILATLFARSVERGARAPWELRRLLVASLPFSQV